MTKDAGNGRGGTPLDEAAQRVVDIAGRRPPIGATRVIGVDGRSGSGKTTFAERVAGAVEQVTGERPAVLHVEDVYPGWEGLEAATGIVAGALSALGRGGDVVHPTWDWANDRPGRPERIGPGAWLVVEGVGCGSAPVRPHLTALAWLEAPDTVRFARAIGRDGDTYLPHWQRWAEQEEALLARDDIRAAADLVVPTHAPDSTTGSTTGSTTDSHDAGRTPSGRPAAPQES